MSGLTGEYLTEIVDYITLKHSINPLLSTEQGSITKQLLISFSDQLEQLNIVEKFIDLLQIPNWENLLWNWLLPCVGRHFELRFS